jgi:hypothetical protein
LLSAAEFVVILSEAKPPRFAFVLAFLAVLEQIATMTIKKYDRQTSRQLRSESNW